MGVHRWRPDPDDPIGVAREDKGNFIIPRNELVKQMEYGGTGLYFTGHYVWNRFVDKPNPQLLAPRLTLDPVPNPNPRPDFPDGNYIVTEDGTPLVTENGDHLVYW